MNSAGGEVALDSGCSSLGSSASKGSESPGGSSVGSCSPSGPLLSSSAPLALSQDKLFKLSSSDSDLSDSRESLGRPAMTSSRKISEVTVVNRTDSVPLSVVKMNKSLSISAAEPDRHICFSSPDLMASGDSPLSTRGLANSGSGTQSPAVPTTPKRSLFRFPFPRITRKTSSELPGTEMLEVGEKTKLRGSNSGSKNPVAVRNNLNAVGLYMSGNYGTLDSRLRDALIQNPTGDYGVEGDDQFRRSTSDQRETSNLLCAGRSHEKATRLSSREDPGPLRSLDLAPCTSKSASCPSLRNAPGLKYKLVREGQMQVCRLQHPRSVFGKIAHSKLLRRWEWHTLVLDKEEISSRSGGGVFERSIPYSTIEDVHVFPHWDTTDRYCIRIYVADGSMLLQSNHSYSRNQWLHSIQWRRQMLKFKKIFEKLERPEILLRELKSMVSLVQNASLQDDRIFSEPLELCATVLTQIQNGKLPKQNLEPVIVAMAPLLENFSPIPEICDIFSKFCRDYPRSSVVDEVFTVVANQVLKKNMDFGKTPSLRTFLQDFVLALNSKNNGTARVREFIQGTHGPGSNCPHPRVLPNLVSVCLAAVHSLYDEQGLERSDHTLESKAELDQKLECFASIFDVLSQFEDWRLQLASIIQPVPFPDAVLTNPLFIRYAQSIIERIGTDNRCEVHLTVLGIREGKVGWFHLLCPGGLSCADEGGIYAKLLNTLLHCCCKRKKFFQSLNGMLGPLQLLALRETEPAMEALCSMLELDVVEGEDLKVQMITALQSTPSGKKYYAQLCDRQIALRELQQKGGPRKLTWPSKSTDHDLAVLFSSGSFGNLEWLSLAFTNVTSACAEHLVKLPSLKYLNLWSTQFGDLGVQLISEHLHKLQVLNLCETPVTDKGLLALTALKSLRKLNLNSTQLSADTFQTLKATLPALQEVDVRYTDAWCADEITP